MIKVKVKVKSEVVCREINPQVGAMWVSDFFDKTIYLWEKEGNYFLDENGYKMVLKEFLEEA
jgi:hypothetical protein